MHHIVFRGDPKSQIPVSRSCSFFRAPSSYFNQCLILILFTLALYQNHILDFQSIDKACKSIDFSPHIHMGYRYNERLNSMSPRFPF